MSQHKIAIGITSGADCRVHWVGLISAFQAMSGRDWSDYKFEMIPSSGLYIGLNRNEIVETFLQGDSDYLLFIDHDNGFFPDFMDYFMEDMANPDVKIVSGVYYLKDPRQRVFVAGQKPKNEVIFRCDHYPEEAFVRKGLLNITRDFDGDGGLVGAGMLMIKREVFLGMEFPYFEERFHSVASNTGTGKKLWYYLGEDNYFCMKVQQSGFDIYLDTRIRSPHMMNKSCFPPNWIQYKEARLWT